jgi:hypothetical protein
MFQESNVISPFPTRGEVGASGLSRGVTTALTPGVAGGIVTGASIVASQMDKARRCSVRILSNSLSRIFFFLCDALPLRWGAVRVGTLILPWFTFGGEKVKYAAAAGGNQRPWWSTRPSILGGSSRVQRGLISAGGVNTSKQLGTPRTRVSVGEAG